VCPVAKIRIRSRKGMRRRDKRPYWHTGRRECGSPDLPNVDFELVKFGLAQATGERDRLLEALPSAGNYKLPVLDAPQTENLVGDLR
jgi:hypothetical protein